MRRRGARSVAQCYSGCGAGEITGLIIAVGILQMGTIDGAAITFSLAYLSGIALTVGPIMQEGTGFGAALKDAWRRLRSASTLHSPAVPAWAMCCSGRG